MYIRTLMSITSVTMYSFYFYYCIFLCLYLFSWSIPIAFIGFFKWVEFCWINLLYCNFVYFINVRSYIYSFLFLCSLSWTWFIFNFLKSMSSLIFILLFLHVIEFPSKTQIIPSASKICKVLVWSIFIIIVQNIFISLFLWPMA